MEQATLLQRYRCDRRKLLEFVLSSGLIKELRTPSGPTNSLSNLDVDSLSADYILQCVKSGGVIDVTEATKKYLDESAHPVTIHSQIRNSYFLISNPDLSGSPPRRVPPPIFVNRTADATSASSYIDYLHVENATTSGDDYNPKYKTATIEPTRSGGNSEIPVPSLGLPSLKTGLSDDDLRESAYELLLASMFLSGAEVCPVEDRKKEKGSKFLTGLKGKRDRMRSQSQSSGRKSELMDIVRVQMQISEAMDACTRRNVMQLATRKMFGQIDLPHISVGLLNGTFKSDFLNEKSYMQWKSRQANILEELLCSANVITTEDPTIIRSYCAKIRDVKEWDDIMSASERVAVLASIRQVAVKLSTLPGQYGIQGETFYWTASYPLNIRLYQKLLFGLFDVLDEDQLIEEADEVLLLIKLTWSSLGITQRMHNALYGWVLFQQFVRTGGSVLLENAVLELQKVLPAEEDDMKEEQYMNSIVCSNQSTGSDLKLHLVEAIFISISVWCDYILQDYHLHFSQKPANFRITMTLVSAIGILASDDSGEIKLMKLNALDGYASQKLKSYVQRSTEAAYRRAESKVDFESKVGRTHPLALLAEELKLIADRELHVFCSVLRRWCPESVIVLVVLLHQFYGERLKPFLKDVSSLSGDARLVLPAAYMLDGYLTQLYTSALEANQQLNSFNPVLEHYQIGEISKPLIIDWVISQHAHILEWTERAFNIEDWEPLSHHQRQAASIVEVFRIIEETVDQFFGFNLPMDVTHLQALLSVIFHSLDAYLMKIVNQLVEKSHLYPSAPPLTRYTETVIPMIKKRLLECTLLDDNVSSRLKELTISKLCIRLNTLQFIQKQVGILEDGIRSSWVLVRPSHDQRQTKGELVEERSSLTSNEAIDALFATTFNIIKDTTTDAISKFSGFIGTRVVFWDLRDRFLFHLYRSDVASSRWETFLPHIDTVLDHICGLIDDTLRDRVVLSVFRALLEGYVWVLLDGGPSRAFSDSDITMMEDDFNMLKEFFVADGEGLPRSLVEQEAKFAQRILGLFSLQTETVIRMLMDASEHISMGLASQHGHGHMCLEDAHTLVRVLCHKKDREASKFLKKQYDLPMSSEYDDAPSSDSSFGSPFISDFLKRNASLHWTKNSQSSFKSIRKKLQAATSEIRDVAR